MSCVMSNFKSCCCHIYSVIPKVKLNLYCMHKSCYQYQIIIKTYSKGLIFHNKTITKAKANSIAKTTLLITQHKYTHV